MLAPQLWPHSHLSLAYVSKDIKYDDLTLVEFSAEFAAIMHRPTIPGTWRLHYFDVLGNQIL